MPLIRVYIIALLFICFPFFVKAQSPQAQLKQPRILVLLDGSSSMLTTWHAPKTRFNAAGDFVLTLMDSIYAINNQVEFSLRVFGHQYPAQNNNCYDTRNEVMFSKNNMWQMQRRLNSIIPYGVSPIAFSLGEAANFDMPDLLKNTYSLILITDGAESCGGNICQVVEKLLKAKISFKPYVISMVNNIKLEQEYNCLGQYLQVSGPSELVPAVQTIIEGYRRQLLVKNIVQSNPNTVIARPPMNVITTAPNPVKEESRVIEKPKAVDTPKVVIQPKPADTPKVIKPVRPVVDTTVVMKPAKADTPAAKPLVPVKYMATRRVRTTKIYVMPPTFATMPIPTYQLVQPDPEDMPSPKPNIPANTPVLKPVENATSKPVTRATGTTIKPNTPARKDEEMKVTIQTEDAAESGVQVYFTDGRGKYYATTPQIFFRKTGTVTKVIEYYRTVNASGTPDLQKIPAGNYDIGLSLNGKILKSNITIGANKKTRIDIVVTNGSLSFAYRNNPSKPVEFTAQVEMLFEKGPKIVQQCTESLEYPPGNYHVTISTLPIQRRNVDILFGSQSVITLDEPGYLQIINTDQAGTLTLYQDRKTGTPEPFYNLKITGELEKQKLQLYPGNYIGRLSNGRGAGGFVQFVVQPNMITEVYVN